MPTDPASRDHHSFARPEAVRVTHMALDLSIDFDAQRLTGTVVYHLDRVDDAAPLRLDVRGPEILSVTLGEGADAPPGAFNILPGDALLGDALEIPLPPGVSRVTIRYATTEDATGLQWLTPAQTRGGRHPYLYTQAQTIHARSFVPCQDTPSVRATFEAKLRVPAGLKAVMCAPEAKELGEADGWSLHAFTMPHPIPSYLLGFAVGNLAFRSLGERTGVWAEPEIVDAAAWEYADIEAMVAAVESRFGAYRWGRYDLLVMPPSFPLGGMENPCLTFVSPSTLAGDRSLVSIIAHELAHSWSGNLVCNATWRDFWLNEGFTVYLEHRILELIYGEDRYRMEVELGMAELARDLAMEPPFAQVLHIDLTGRDPDEGFSAVPYQKGAAFLRRLEQAVGRPVFDAFLRAWLDGHAFESVTTRTFLTFLEAELLRAHPAARRVDLDAWIRGSGLPEEAPRARYGAFANIDAFVSAWDGSAQGLGALVATGWGPFEWLHFLGAVDGRVDAEGLGHLDARFGLGETGNAEIACAFLTLAAQVGYAPALPRIRSYLASVGRTKLIKPIYRALMANPDLADLARATYRDARPTYHGLTTNALDPLFG